MSLPTRSRDLSEFPDGWQEELKSVSDAIFGQWGDKGRKRGVLERLTRIEYGVMGIGILVIIKFTGVPTEKLFPFLVALFGHGG